MKYEKGTNSPNARERRGNRSRTEKLLGAAAVASATLLLFPRAHHAPTPQHHEKTYIKLAQDEAQHPYNPDDPSTGKFIINIEEDKSQTDNISPSERVLNNRIVIDYIKTNPSEAPSITSSAYALPPVNYGEHPEYALVDRDIDHDGDDDVVVVPVETK